MLQTMDASPRTNMLEAPEFGLELVLSLPFCYHAHVERRLLSTQSLAGMEHLYYFSPEHHTVPGRRACRPVQAPSSDSCPLTLHNVPVPPDEWLSPPYRDRFQREGERALRGIVAPHRLFGRPLFLLHNKVCDEWGRGNIHRIPDTDVAQLVQVLCERYSVVYIRPTGIEKGFTPDHNQITEGHSDLLEAERAGAVVFQHLLRTTQIDYNLLQLYLHSNCGACLSVQGGNSALASCFGGINLVYAREGVELQRGLYNTLFPLLSGADIRVARSLQELHSLAREV